MPQTARRPLSLVCNAPFIWSSGHLYLLAAVARAVESGTDLRVILLPPRTGPAPMEAQVRFDILDLDLSDHVLVVGRRKSPVAVDGHVLPFVAPGHRRRCRSAVRSGLPVVGFDGPWLDGLRQGNVSCVARRDTRALADALAGLGTRELSP